MTRISTHRSRPSWPSGTHRSPSPRSTSSFTELGLTIRAGDLLLELKAAHVQLRELFAPGLDDAVIVLARDVMELASETTDVLNQDQGPSGS